MIANLQYILRECQYSHVNTMFPLNVLLACALALNAAARATQAHFDASSLQDSQSSFYFDLDALRLVQLFDDGEPQWLTERQKLKLKANGIDFFDMYVSMLSSILQQNTRHITSTDDQLLGPVKAPKQHFTYPNLNGTKATKIVTSIIANLSVAEPKANLNHLSSFWTRFYNSPSGKASSEWLADKISDYIVQYQSEEDERNITVTLVQHKFLQNSVVCRLYDIVSRVLKPTKVVRIAPQNASESDPVTVVGAHCDSINRFDPLWRAPGADDDGSGTVAILESLRGGHICTQRWIRSQLLAQESCSRVMFQRRPSNSTFMRVKRCLIDYRLWNS